jgi:hypothetical protein
MKNENDSEPGAGARGHGKHRVIAIAEGTRERMRGRREALGLTLRGFVQHAVASELPPLLAALEELGLAVDPAAATRPIRLPLDPDRQQELREAGARCGLPAARLLELCLDRASRRKRRRCRDAGGDGSEAAPRRRGGRAARAGRAGG